MLHSCRPGAVTLFPLPPAQWGRVSTLHFTHERTEAKGANNLARSWLCLHPCWFQSLLHTHPEEEALLPGQLSSASSTGLFLGSVRLPWLLTRTLSKKLVTNSLTCTSRWGQGWHTYSVKGHSRALGAAGNVVAVKSLSFSRGDRGSPRACHRVAHQSFLSRSVWPAVVDWPEVAGNYFRYRFRATCLERHFLGYKEGALSTSQVTCVSSGLLWCCGTSLSLLSDNPLPPDRIPTWV